MTKTARAAVYDEPNTPFVIREFAVDGPNLSGAWRGVQKGCRETTCSVHPLVATLTFKQRSAS